MLYKGNEKEYLSTYYQRNKAKWAEYKERKKKKIPKSCVSITASIELSIKLKSELTISNGPKTMQARSLPILEHINWRKNVRCLNGYRLSS